CWASWGLARLYDTELFRMPFVIRPQTVATTVIAAAVFCVLAHLPVAYVIRSADKLPSLNVRE
ncbi:MAG: hypothetical protein D6725_00680, partial [Planctomycetota bacterium]